MKKRTWMMWIFIVVIALITIVLYTQSKPKGSMEGQLNQASQNVIRFEAVKEDINNKIEVKGKSSYATETWVYPPFTSEVKTWHVLDGMQVKKGDVLFELADDKLRESIKMQQANLRKQELELKLNQMRSKLEHEHNSVHTLQSDSQTESMNQAFNRYAKDELESVQAELDRIQQDMASKQLSDSQENLAKAKYLAEESGIFLFQNTKEPNRVSDEQPIGKIVDTSKLQLITTVGEYEVFQIQPGMEVSIRADALKNTQIKGKVELISKFAKAGTEQSTGSAQFEVTISLEADTSLIAGLSVTGLIETDKRVGATVVPTLAILRDQDEYFVYVERDGLIEKQTIKLGLETPDKTEVLEGIQVGETIVLQ